MKWVLLIVLFPVVLLAAPKHMIVMIPDGTGVASLTVARELKGAPLAMDAYLRGLMQTRSASHRVTDSAAAGTAMACGVRTRNGSVGVTPEGVPLLSIAEWAKGQGKAVGIVTTDWIVGATPSAFSAHAMSRQQGKQILTQQLTSGFDLFMGGGREALIPELETLLRKEGYALVEDKTAMEAHTEGKLFGLFAPGLLTAEVERRAGKPCTEPTLAEMTRKALALLEKDENGLFLMIEGAQVDKANHEHDLPWATYELLAFDEAVREVMAWAQAHPDAVVIFAPDHETGGLTIHDGASAEALSEATTKQFQQRKPEYYGVNYATTWHTAVDVFYGTNDPALHIERNIDIFPAMLAIPPRQLIELSGTTVEENGEPVLNTPDGKRFFAQRDAIFIPETQKWYARGLQKP